MKHPIFLLFSYVLLTQVVEGNLEDFNCVDIYKQPAFQHPLLKHHKIQEKFSSNGSFERKNKYKTNDQICPKGTVPILRQRNGTESVHLDTVEFLGQHFATIETILDGSIYRGAEADISIHNLTLGTGEFSKSSIWLENGPRNELNSIQVGWAVHQRLYSDSLTRFTIYWTADGYKTGCYNTQCPGFVIVSRNPWIGRVFSESSIYGGNFTVLFTPRVFQAVSSGNWALQIYDEVIGYWPNELFTHLKEGATMLRFGGNTYIAPDGTSPPMGNGHFPIPDFHKSSHYLNVKVRNSNNQLVDIEDSKTRPYADSDCYRVSYWGPMGPLGKTFSFGGPGGNCGT